MADTSIKPAGVSGPRRRLVRVLGWSLGLLLVLLLLLCLLATSAAVFKRVVLPRVSDSLNAKVTVEDATLRPWSRVRLFNLKVQTTGAEPLLEAKEAYAEYRLTDILRGNLRIDRVTIDSPRVVIVQNADGTSNLDPLLEESSILLRKPRPDDDPPEMALGVFSLKNGSIRQVRHRTNGPVETIEISGLNIEAANFKNGQTATVKVDGSVQSSSGTGAGATQPGQGKISADWSISFDPSFKVQAIEGKTQIEAAALDATPYYNLLTQSTGTEAPAPADEPVSQTSKPPGGEPSAVSLPFKQFQVALRVGQFTLRDLAITNWQADAVLNGGKLTLDPLRLTLNGAPVEGKGTIDLGVAGYAYDLDLSARNVPIGPFVNSFIPEQRGKYQGDLTLVSRIKGAGITGASLQKNLDGNVFLAFTNAQFQVFSQKLRRFLSPVAALLQVPQIVDSPLSGCAGRISAGGGQLDFQTLHLVSPLFILDTQGKMPIATVLTNSPFKNWPVNFYLRGVLARTIRLATGSRSSDDYVKLPDFLRVGGTLGNPKAEIDRSALAGSLLGTLGERVPGLDEKTGGLLKNVGELLSGRTAGPTSTNTNAAPAKPGSGTATNTVPNLLELFKRKKK